ALNTLVLLASGVTLLMAHRAFTEFDSGRTKKMLAFTLGLGAFFVVFQGHEWVRLISFGLTMTSSTYGSFFYLIVGAHALHAVAALLVLSYCALHLAHGELTQARFLTAQLFWYFVVLLWPILYILVYLL